MTPEDKPERNEPTREGVLFLVFKDGKVLLERRINPDKAYYGYTIIPGGKVEKDKDKNNQDAMMREVGEELGIKPTKFILLDSFQHITITGHHYRTAAWLITEYRGEITNNEPGKAEHVWVDINEALSLIPFADSRYVIRLAKSELKLG